MKICKLIVTADRIKDVQDICFANKIFWLGCPIPRYYTSFQYICIVKYSGCDLSILRGDSISTFDKCDAFTIDFKYLKENIANLVKKYGLT